MIKVRTFFVSLVCQRAKHRDVFPLVFEVELMDKRRKTISKFLPVIRIALALGFVCVCMAFTPGIGIERENLFFMQNSIMRIKYTLRT